MITRAHIRRQLRASGGITNVMPREGYFLGSIVRGAKKAVSKVADVAKQVVKSPIGKAAILGLGASYLGPKIMSGGGLKSFFGAGSFNPLRSIVERGPARIASQSGLGKLLGKVGLTTETGGITGLGKMLGAGSLVGYFTSKGASEEEAKELAQDVYRGEGLGFDQIKKDIAAYRGGGLDASQMAQRGYRFLTPRNFVGAKGGRVGLRSGGMNKRRDSFMAAFDDAIDRYMSINDVDVVPMNIQENIFNSLRKKMLGRAEGGRVGLEEGTPDPKDSDTTQQMFVSDEAGAIAKKGGGVLPSDMGKLTKKDFNSEENYKRYLRQLNRTKRAMGGIMDMPMGNMRRNQAGVMERDYRDKGGFVPVGVKEKADDVPAMLSKNEFVMTADAVRGAGDGNIKKGAQRMYDLMKRNEGKVA